MKKHWFYHVEPELDEVYDAIRRGRMTSQAVQSDTGLPERKVQRRIAELRDTGRIRMTKRIGFGTPVYAVNVPSELEGSTVKG